MAGTISLSLSQQFDELGEPLAEGRLYFYRAGTVATPQNAYYDADLTLPFPNPYTLDSAGRIPQFFLADGSIKVVLIDRSGVTQINADNVLVIGPSGGGGGGGTVDPTTVIQTGQVACWYGTGARTGFVRMNGRTVGSSTSGATERANADTQALFLFLWGEDANLSVSGGRGASAAADWAANKTIALPDGRGRSLSGLDDMGASAASVLTTTNYGTSPIVLGAKGGDEAHTVARANLPNENLSPTFVQPTFNTTANDVLITTSITYGGANGPINVPTSTANGDVVAVTPVSATIPLGGSGTELPTVGPRILLTLYMKL